MPVDLYVYFVFSHVSLVGMQFEYSSNNKKSSSTSASSFICKETNPHPLIFVQGMEVRTIFAHAFRGFPFSRNAW